jgi:phage tail sheath protein FI
MPYTYPGVYVTELTSPVHAIVGVATSIPAFVGYTPRGIDNRAQAIFSFADFERLYGGLATDSELSYAVAQFYQNAPGAQAYVVRVPKTGGQADVAFRGLTFTSRSSGAWANGKLGIDVDQGSPADPTADITAFNLTITNLADGSSEYFPGLSLDNTRMNYVSTVINDPDNGSQLFEVTGTPTSTTSAPQVTGILGSAVTAGDIGTALSTGGTPGIAHEDWGFQLDTTRPAAGSVPGLPVTVTVFSDGASIPQSMSGIASYLQRAINAVLPIAVPGATAACSVAPIVTLSGGVPAVTGQAFRISASLPGHPDAVLSIGAPSGTPPNDARAALGLQRGAGTPRPVFNVARYTLGTGNSGWGSQDTSNQVADGSPPDPSSMTGDQLASTGIYALDKVDLFNLLSIPDATRADLSGSQTQAIYSKAIAYCHQRRAFLLVDPPASIKSVSGAIDWISNTLGITDPNGAAFWPRVRLPDPLNNYGLRSFAPSGVVAGVYAATDGNRGVWKAPAGINATLNGVQSLTYPLTDEENGELNPLGLNCLRAFPVYGRVLWGARTLQGADGLASQWKYVPVRRLALFLEESLYRGLKWVVFEPNDVPLWASIRLNVESFLDTLFRKGAFQGTTPAQAYFVKCDSETTTQTDIDNGIVNILVGFAPLKPAEFVVIQLEQLTGQG